LSDRETTIAHLKERLATFVRERDWSRYHDAKNLAMSIAIEAAELMEHFQWLRTEELHTALRDEKLRAEISDEIADVACYLLSLANTLELDLSDAIGAKIAKNEVKYPVQRFKGTYHKPRE